MKTLLVVIMSMLMAASANAMVREVSLGYLAHNSDLIVRAEIEFVKTVGTLPDGVSVIANQAKVNAVIKGNGIKQGDKLRIKTYGNMEDLPSFSEGKLLVLFLKKIDGYYEVFCGVQGAWPVQDGKYLGFGRGKTTDDIRKALDKPETPKFCEEMQLNDLPKIKIPLIATPSKRVERQ